MKKLCVIILLLVPCLALSEVSVGVNLSTDLSTTIEKDETGNQDRETKTTRYNFYLAPTIMFLLNDRFELAPHAGVSVTQSKWVRYIDGDKDYTEENTEIGAGGGCGLFLRLVDKSVFRLSIGPEASFWFNNPEGDDNLWTRTSLGLPLNIDLLITDRFFMRMKFGLFGFSYIHQDQGDRRDSDAITFFNIATTPLPGFGFYVTF